MFLVGTARAHPWAAKLGVPGQEEVAFGAIATGGVRVLDQALIDLVRLPAYVVDQITAAEHRELERRERAYRDDRPLPRVAGRTVIVVDDGLATGATMHGAVQALRAQAPAGIAGVSDRCARGRHHRSRGRATRSRVE